MALHTRASARQNPAPASSGHSGATKRRNKIKKGCLQIRFCSRFLFKSTFNFKWLYFGGTHSDFKKYAVGHVRARCVFIMFTKAFVRILSQIYYGFSHIDGS